jgi:LysM repeat protein
MGAKFVAAVVGVIILVVLAQTFIFGGGNDSPSANRPDSIPTATPPVTQDEPVLLGQGQAGGGSGSGGDSSSGSSSQSTYVVQSGDTLGAIAAQLGVSADEQAAWIADVLDINGMQDARQLQVGQELILPATPGASASSSNPTNTPETQAAASPQPTAPPSATGTAETPTPSAGGSSGTYAVVDGDTPYAIALKYCVDDPSAWAQELLDLNNVEATSLSVGEELELPPGTPPFCADQATPTSDGGT